MSAHFVHEDPFFSLSSCSSSLLAEPPVATPPFLPLLDRLVDLPFSRSSECSPSLLPFGERSGSESV